MDYPQQCVCYAPIMRSARKVRGALPPPVAPPGPPALWQICTMLSVKPHTPHSCRIKSSSLQLSVLSGAFKTLVSTRFLTQHLSCEGRVVGGLGLLQIISFTT